MTDKQKHTCFDCKHYYYGKDWNGEEDFMITECLLGNESSFFDEFECKDFEPIIEHKVCKSLICLYDDDGFIDGCLCKDIKETGFLNCPHLPNETYNCTHYVEGD